MADHAYAGALTFLLLVYCQASDGRWHYIGGGLGDGQTWQNFAASRVPGTTYTNNTGKPIAVSVTFDNVTFGWPASIYVNGLEIRGYYSAGTNFPAGATAIVPAGSTYRAQTMNGSGNIVVWAELR